MGMKVKIPIIVRVDNVGAIFMTENISTSQRTCHVDIRYAYVREFVQDGFLKILFVKTENNLSDGFTKNVTGNIQEKHGESYIVHQNDINQTHG